MTSQRTTVRDIATMTINTDAELHYRKPEFPQDSATKIRELLDYLDDHPNVDTVIVSRVSDLARYWLDLALLEAELARRGITLIDTSTN
jgi:DNA invertase Pin-like site-specific DNA recombinase